MLNKIENEFQTLTARKLIFHGWKMEHWIEANLFQTVLNMFEIWWNQNKFLHHFYQCFQNKFTCSKDDAIKTNYCITIFKQLWTCLKYDAIKTNYCITISNRPGLGYSGLAWVLGFACVPGWAQNSHNAHNARTNKLLGVPRS